MAAVGYCAVPQKEWLVTGRCFCLFTITLVFTHVLSVIKSWLQLFRILSNLPNYSTSTSWFSVDDFVFPFLRKSQPSKMSSFQFLSLPPKFFSSWESFPWKRSSLSSLTKPASLVLLASISLTVLFLAAYKLSWCSLSEVSFLSLSPTPLHCQTWKNNLHTPSFTSSHSFTILSHGAFFKLFYYFSAASSQNPLPWAFFPPCAHALSKAFFPPFGSWLFPSWLCSSYSWPVFLLLTLKWTRFSPSFSPFWYFLKYLHWFHLPLFR